MFIALTVAWALAALSSRTLAKSVKARDTSRKDPKAVAVSGAKVPFEIHLALAQTEQLLSRALVGVASLVVAWSVASPLRNLF